jgi:hypothetical protein
MNRRELLIKAAPLALVPFVKMPPFNGVVLDAIELKPRKFLIFFDAYAIDIDALVTEPIPGWEDVDALFIPVRLRPSQSSVRDALQLVEQFDDKP